MLDDYLDQPAKVQLLTGEVLPDGIKFWGSSPLGDGLLWFAIPRADSPLETEQEFHVPSSAIAKITMTRKR